MAPPSYKTDAWSYGVALYAFVFGRLPFYDVNSLQLKGKILNQEVEFPENAQVSDELKILIGGLLKKEEAERLTIRDAL